MNWCDFNNVQEKKEYYKQRIVEDPYDANAYYEMGTVYEYLLDFDKAAICCEQAIELNPRQAIYYGFKAFVNFKRGDDKKILEAVASLIELGADLNIYCTNLLCIYDVIDKELVCSQVARLRDSGKDSVAYKLQQLFNQA